MALFDDIKKNIKDCNCDVKLPKVSASTDLKNYLKNNDISKQLDKFDKKLVDAVKTSTKSIKDANQIALDKLQNAKEFKGDLSKFATNVKLLSTVSNFSKQLDELKKLKGSVSAQQNASKLLNGLQKEIDNLKEIFPLSSLSLDKISKPALDSINGISSSLQNLINVNPLNNDQFSSTLTASLNNIDNLLDKLRDFTPLSMISNVAAYIPELPLKTPIQITQELTNKCFELQLQQLNNLDPTVRLKQLMDKLTELCSTMQFEQMKQVIDLIQQTKLEIVTQALSIINDPFERMKKLEGALTDAINAGSKELSEQLSGLIKFEKLKDLQSNLDKLDPNVAIGLLNQEIQRLVSLGKIDEIQEVLTELEILQSKFQTVQNMTNKSFDDVNKLLGSPEQLLKQLQSDILKNLDLKNYTEVRASIAAFQSWKSNVDSIITGIDPNEVLRKGTDILNSKMKNLDISGYNQVINNLAGKICGQPNNLSLPPLPI